MNILKGFTYSISFFLYSFDKEIYKINKVLFVFNKVLSYNCISKHINNTLKKSTDMLNISKEGIEKAMNSRNNVLAAMGFDSDESVVGTEEVKTTNNDSFSKYGDVIETEISTNVFEVAYEKQDLYIQELNKQSKGYFVGE